MIGFLFFLFGVLVTLGMSALAARSDYKGFKIPNIVPIVIVLAFAVSYSVLTLTEQRDVFFKPIGVHIGAALLVLMVTGAMFALKQLGAGDSKFATAIALWVGLQGLAPFLFYMALTGGVVAAISLSLRKWKPVKNPVEGSWVDAAQKGSGNVPYGIAIAVGALVGFLFQGYFSLSHWEQMF